MAEPMTTANRGYISDALTGKEESGGNEERKKKSIGRGQTIASDFALDNVELAYEVDGTSNGTCGGSVTNLAHSLKGASAVSD